MAVWQVSFVAFNKSFSMPINQISHAVKCDRYGAGGSSSVFSSLLDEEPEVDDGYVDIGQCKGRRMENWYRADERTGHVGMETHSSGRWNNVTYARAGRRCRI